MQIEILSSEAIMMTSWVNWRSNVTWNNISESYSIKIWKKIGVTLHPKELQWILYRHVFAHICYVLQELARTEIYVKRSLLIVTKRQTRYQFVCKYMWNIIKEKNGESMLCNTFTRENARACVCARFFIKCLEWPKTYAKWFWDDFEHFKILRAHSRADIRARAHYLSWN